MYIEFRGYITYFDEYLIKLDMTRMPGTNGFFIYADGDVYQSSFDVIRSIAYSTNMPDGTVFINCGDKYVEELTHTELKIYNKKPSYLNVIN